MNRRRKNVEWYEILCWSICLSVVIAYGICWWALNDNFVFVNLVAVPALLTVLPAAWVVVMMPIQIRRCPL